MKYLYEEIYSYIENLDIIDCHEHLPPNAEIADIEKENDIIMAFSQYVKEDLMCAGLPSKMYQNYVKNPEIDILAKWSLIEPYWEKCRYTGYVCSVHETVKILYGVERISSDTIEYLNSCFIKMNQKDYFHIIMKDYCKIHVAIRYAHFIKEDEGKGDTRYFVDSYPLIRYLNPLSSTGVEKVFNSIGLEITGFDDYLEAICHDLEQKIKNGAYIFKLFTAYYGPLNLKNCSKQKARMEFEKEIRRMRTFIYESPVPSAFENLFEFSDYVTHFILRILNKHSCVLQVHTGLQSGNGNLIQNADATLMCEVISKYKNIQYDLFHISYPYQNSLIAMAKMFPNVYINFAWTHIISPNASVKTLIECLNTIPMNKIMGFGGDHEAVINVAGHLTIARQNIAKALSIGIEQDLLTLSEAKKFALMILYENPKRLYRI